MRPIIMRCELTSRLGRTRPAHARSRGSETLLRIPSLAGYTIDTHESRFRKRQVIPQFGGPVMTISSLTSTQQTKAMHQVSSANDVRTIIANHLGIDVERVTAEAHFTDDLGADWLERLELMIVIEDQFPAVEITDDDVDQIEVVGDLIRHIKGAWVVRRDGAPIVEAPLH